MILTCKYCGKTYNGRSDSRFCSAKCKNTYHNKVRLGEKKVHKDILKESLLLSQLDPEKKYAIFNMIPDYGEFDYSYTSVYFSDDGEELEDRRKYTILKTPETLFKSKSDIIREFKWLKEHYIKTAYFKIVCLENRKMVHREIVIVPQKPTVLSTVQRFCNYIKGLFKTKK